MIEGGENPFGEVVGFDPFLLSQPGILQGLMVRHREPDCIFLANQDSVLVTLAGKAWKGGPNRILVEQVPALETPVPTDGWFLQDRALRIPFLAKLPLKRSKSDQTTLTLTPVRDYPGHMHLIINRHRHKSDDPLEEKLNQLGQALEVRLTEALEPALLTMIGRGEGRCTSGDLALSGMLLTARALILGNRLRLPWQTWFSMEIRRFLHRTNFFGQNLLQFALDGRVTEFQAKFFAAMSRDYEGADDVAAQEIITRDPWSGLPFLLGVRTVLDAVRPSLFGPLPRGVSLGKA